MAKRKKYPKLPNSFGSIKYLGRNRRNPYGVYPPCTEFTLDGIPVTKKALCYVDDWMKGFAVLTAYQAGRYTEGMENTLDMHNGTAAELNTLAQRILADYSRMKNVPEETTPQKTFAEVYRDFYDFKFEQDNSRVYSQATMNSCRAAFRNCAPLHDKVFASLRYPDLQKTVDDCPLSHASLELIVSLFHQMYEYATIYELVDKDYSAAVKIKIRDDCEHGAPFTLEELASLWEHRENPTAEMLLVMCYSGYRISAYGCLLPCSVPAFREDMYALLEELGIPRHTPHGCRHTFSALCEKYGVNENDRKRMLGHAFGSDITNSVYGHRSVDDLRAEIEKIPAPPPVCC